MAEGLRSGALDAEVLRPSGALLATSIALGAAIERDAVTDTGYDPTTLDLLVRLDLAPGRSLRAVELCRQLRLSASHVSRSIDKAVAAGLMERRPDPGDRRAKVVSLTARGEAVVADFAPRLEAVLAEVVFATLDPDEVEQLIALLTRIEDAAVTRLENLSGR